MRGYGPHTRAPDGGADAVLEMASVAPAWRPAVRSVYGAGAGKYFSEWDPTGRNCATGALAADPESGEFSVPCNLMNVAGSWFEGSVDRISVCLFRLPPSLRNMMDVDVLKLCPWACAQRTYARTSATAGPSIIMILHWIPEHFYEHGRPEPGDVLSMLGREGLPASGCMEFRRLNRPLNSRAHSLAMQDARQ